MPGILFKAYLSVRRRFHNTGLGRVPGIKRLHHWLYRATRPDEAVLAQVQGSRMYVDPRESIQHPGMLMHGIVDPGQTELFRRLIKPAMVVVDIGANIGYYTCLAARLLGGTGHVYAFEPFPRNFELLRRNIEVNQYANVTAINKGVAGRYDRLKLYLDRDSGLCHSLVAHPGHSSGQFIEIDVVGLDDFFERETPHRRADVIKIDAECAEGLIIGGARRLLSQAGISVFMEFNAVHLPTMGTDPQELLRLIKELGFTLSLIDDQTGGLQPIGIEAAFERSLQLGGHLELLLQK